MTLGTVPLARMMRTEVQGSGTSSITLNLGSVNVGDRIMVFAMNVSSSTATTINCYQSAGTATVDFGGEIISLAQSASGNTFNKVSCSGICRVLTGGTLTLNHQGNGTGTLTIYAHAIVLNNG